MQSITQCIHCRNMIDLYKQREARKFVYADRGPPEYGRVIGVECDSCKLVHPAPGRNEEDWFE